MAWEKCSVEEQRLLMVKELLLKEESITHICKKYNISRRTAYKWYERYLEQGMEGLKDLSKIPHKLPVVFSPEQINIALNLKLKHRCWGPKKILVKLLQAYPDHDWPCPTRLYEIYPTSPSLRLCV